MAKDFIATITDHTLLSKEKENELSVIIQNSTSDSSERKKAILELVEGNMRLLVKEAQRYARLCNCDVHDLINEGYIGLHTAAERFDPSKGSAFAGFSTYWIRNSIKKLLSHRQVYIPAYLRVDIGKYKRLTSREEMSNEEIMKKMKINKKRLNAICMANVSVASIHDIIGNSEKPFRIEDALACNNESTDTECDKSDLLNDALNSLTDMERNIVVSQYIENEKKTLHELSLKHGFSAERIRQIKDNSLKKMKQYISSRIE